MAPFACFCGITCANVGQLYDHATAHGHRYMCSCGKLFGVREQVRHHQRTVTHDGKMSHSKLEALKGLPGTSHPTPHRCLLCKAREFKDGIALAQHYAVKHYADGTIEDNATTAIENLEVNSESRLKLAAVTAYGCKFCPQKSFTTVAGRDAHTSAKHPSCPLCARIFHDKYGKNYRTARDQLGGHQRGTGHCYCAVHRTSFSSVETFEAHKKKHVPYLVDHHIETTPSSTVDEAGEGVSTPENDDDKSDDDLIFFGATPEHGFELMTGGNNDDKVGDSSGELHAEPIRQNAEEAEQGNAGGVGIKLGQGYGDSSRSTTSSLDDLISFDSTAGGVMCAKEHHDTFDDDDWQNEQGVRLSSGMMAVSAYFENLEDWEQKCAEHGDTA